MRLKTMAAFGAGYIYGMKAGAKRWQQITHLSELVAASPVVHDVLTRVQESGSQVLQKVSSAASSRRNGYSDEEIDLE